MCGINAVLFYAPQIFEATGFKDEQALLTLVCFKGQNKKKLTSILRCSCWACGIFSRRWLPFFWSIELVENRCYWVDLV